MLKNKFNIPALLLLTTLIFVSINTIDGHGMMLDPVSRSSRWRYDKSAPINYDDNGLFCGGFGVQWFKNNGKCGLCGDDFAASRPRPNELGGMYGQGVITKAYSQSQNARLGIKITTNHLGFFYFNICNLDKFKVESEKCFSSNQIKFSNGSIKMYIGTKAGMIYPTIILPKDLNCKHCVLRWNYQAGNNWGPCGNGTSALGCGPQENFKGCSDISITKKSSRTKTNLKKRLFKVKLNGNNNLDYDDFEPRKKSFSRHSLEQYLYKSPKENDFNGIFFKLENKEKANQIFDKEVDFDIDNIHYETEKEQKTAPVFIKDQFYKEGDGTFDKELQNKPDYILYDFKEMQDEVPELDKVDEDVPLFLKPLNVLYEFDKKELEKNTLDKSVNDLDDILLEYY